MFTILQFYVSITSHVSGTGLECYYCYGHSGTEKDECDSDITGEPVYCQMHDPKFPHYGDVCSIGHTGYI